MVFMTLDLVHKNSRKESKQLEKASKLFNVLSNKVLLFSLIKEVNWKEKEKLQLNLPFMVCILVFSPTKCGLF